MKFAVGILIGILVGAGALYLLECLEHQREKAAQVAEPVFETSSYEVFRFTLEEEVVKKIGKPEEGFLPEHFIEVFPGLSISDFNGVSGTGGKYKIENGALVFVVEEAELVPSSTGFVTGYSGLFLNVAERNKIDVATSGTITDVMRVITTE